jgi:tRNA dimethylallyltransferase
VKDTRPAAIALMGPTASGKTAAAIALAREFDGEIVSVDSALVYRGLDIGSAKPTLGERQGIPHHLLDLREPHQPYSAADFAADARLALEGIRTRGRLPILVGGTGLYFRALVAGLSPMPEADPAIRAAIEAEATRSGWAALHAQLAEVDPTAAARIHATDPQRIQRALEVYRSSGRPLSDWQGQGGGRPFPFRLLRLALVPGDRALLHARIAARLDAMLEKGFLDEVRRLREHPGLGSVADPSVLPALRAVGYRQALEHLQGRIDAAGFRSAAIAATRQLAKRQLTWLRGELAFRWIDPHLGHDELRRSGYDFLVRQA